MSLSSFVPCRGLRASVCFRVCSNRRNNCTAYGLVLIAACLWATLGPFYCVLSEEYGQAKGVIVTYRAGISAVVLFVMLGIFNPCLLHVRWQDWLYFVLFGSVGVAAFFLCYIQATTTGPLTITAVLGWLTVVPPEPLTGWQLLGNGCVLAAVIVLATTCQTPQQLTGERISEEANAGMQG